MKAVKKNIGMRFTDEDLKELNKISTSMGQSRSGMCADWVQTLLDVAKVRGGLYVKTLLCLEKENLS